MELTHKQLVFIEEYLTCWNATEAARRAGYEGSSAHATGYKTLRKPAVREAIAARMAEKTLAANEVLARLSAHARADIREFIRVTEDGSFTVDLKRAEEQGVLHLIRRLRVTPYGTEIELHNAQAALFKIAQVHGLLNDRIEHTGRNGAPIQYEDTGTLTDERRIELLVAILDRARTRLAAPAGGEGAPALVPPEGPSTGSVPH